MAEPAVGTPFALLYIPAMKDKVWGLLIIRYRAPRRTSSRRARGTTSAAAMPGGIGNFAIAAHRSTHDEPFANIDAQARRQGLRPQQWWYVYTLVKDDPKLAPTDVWVVDPVPGHPGPRRRRRSSTMTTRTPRFGSTGRWAWWGRSPATASRCPTVSTPQQLTTTGRDHVYAWLWRS